MANAKAEAPKKTGAVKKTPVKTTAKTPVEKAPAGIDIKELLESGAHFGHKTSRWHPKMAPYIHSKRGGSHIIDLTKTVAALEEALAFIEKTTSGGKQVLLVGTKRQAQEIVDKLALETGMPFVTQRWVGGLLTNQNTMSGRIKHLKDLEAKLESGQLEAKYSKLEIQRFQEEVDGMNVIYGGVKNMAARPAAVFVIDIMHEHNAVKEARKLGIKTVAIVDTNADPTLVDYPIPANDDAIKTIQLICDYVGKAIQAGKSKVKTTKDMEEEAPVAKKATEKVEEKKNA